MALAKCRVVVMGFRIREKSELIVVVHAERIVRWSIRVVLIQIAHRAYAKMAFVRRFATLTRSSAGNVTLSMEKVLSVPIAEVLNTEDV